MYQHKGFTLIELLVVVLIIGILAAVALPQYTKAVNKSRMTQALTWARNIRDAAQVYFMANGGYTKELEDLDISLPQCSKDGDANMYQCADGYRFQLTSLPSVYVYIPKKYTNDKSVGIEYYINSDVERRLCFASPAVQQWVDICKSYGGSLYADRDNLKYYTLP